jgi:hypothetical protein
LRRIRVANGTAGLASPAGCLATGSSAVPVRPASAGEEGALVATGAGAGAQIMFIGLDMA